jgi:hypothetical protein
MRRQNLSITPLKNNQFLNLSERYQEVLPVLPSTVLASNDAYPGPGPK